MIAAIVAGAYAPSNVSPAEAQPVPGTTSEAPLTPYLRMLDVRIATGDDDLRDDSKVFVGLTLRSGQKIELPFVASRRLPDRTSFSRELAPAPIQQPSISAVEVRFEQGRGGGLQGADQWVMQGVEVVGFTEDGRSRTVHASAPSKKFQSSGVWRSSEIQSTAWGPATCGPPKASELCLEVGHGGDDLRSDSGATIHTDRRPLLARTRKT